MAIKKRFTYHLFDIFIWTMTFLVVVGSYVESVEANVDSKKKDGYRIGMFLY